MTQETPSSQSPSASAAAGSPAHLWPLDIVRLSAFAAVIMVHSIAFTERPANVVAAGVMMLLQFGREVFFALTAFVLMYSYINRPVDARRFWRKRFPLVVVPYLAWSAIYIVVTPMVWGTPTFGFDQLAGDVFYGLGKYHLYFLLVTMQIYLLFPLLARFVRATADRAVRVLVIVGIVNVVWLTAVDYFSGPGGALTWLWDRAYELAPTYTLCILAGAYAAVHLRAIEDLLRRRARLMWQVAAGCAAFALLAYVVQLPFLPPRTANAVLQPAMLATCLGAAIALYLLGLRWSDRGRRHEHLVRVGSDVSFGVYLAHPLVLMLLLGLGLDNIGQRLPAPISTVLAFVGAVAGSVVLVLLLRRTPLSYALTGRPRLHATRHAAAADEAVSATPLPAAVPALPAVASSLARNPVAPFALLQRNLPEPI